MPPSTPEPHKPTSSSPSTSSNHSSPKQQRPEPLHIPAASPDWTCKDLIFAAHAQKPMTTYHAVRICSAVITRVPESPHAYRDLVFIQPSGVEEGQILKKWKVPNTVCNFASGCVDDGSSIGLHARALVAGEMGLSAEEFDEVTIAAVFEGGIEGFPILVVAVRMDIDFDAESLVKIERLKIDPEKWQRRQVETQDANQFHPEELKWCVLAAFEMREEIEWGTKKVGFDAAAVVRRLRVEAAKVAAGDGDSMIEWAIGDGETGDTSLSGSPAVAQDVEMRDANTGSDEITSPCGPTCEAAPECEILWLGSLEKRAEE